MDFSFLKDDSKTRLVIAGERDDYGPVDEIMKIVGTMNPAPPVIIIPGADHFFSGSTADLVKALESMELAQVTEGNGREKNSVISFK